MEKVAWATKLPVVLSGIETAWGLISNNGHFDKLIRAFESSRTTARRVLNAYGFSLYYTEKDFAQALVMTDPRGYESVTDLSEIPSFHAHRILRNINN